MQASVETTKMSTKGQVIIPKRAREFTGSGKETIFTVFPFDKDTIVLRKLDSEKIVKEFRLLRAKVKGKLSEAEVCGIVGKARRGTDCN